LLHLHLFGSPQIIYNGQTVSGFVSNKARALLFYLAATTRPHSREILAELLWADTPATARANLKKALSNLRTLSPIPLRTEAGAFETLDLTRCWVDVIEFAQIAECPTKQPVDALRRAAQLYTGDLLAGFNISLTYEFEAWALREQALRKEQMIAILQQLADAEAHQHLLEPAIQTLRRLLDLDPLREDMHRRLMTLLWRNDDRSGALAQFEICCRHLRKELEVEPTAETLAILDQIRRSDARMQPIPLAQDATEPIPEFLQGDASAPPPTPLVAREEELAWLAQRLGLALTGQGHVAFVVGDAGSGKTALLDAFVRQSLAAHPRLIVAGGNCSAYGERGDAYLPFREILTLLTGDVEARWRAGAIDRDQAARLWSLLPLTVQSLLTHGPDLLDIFLSPATLRERVAARGAPEITPLNARLSQPPRAHSMQIVDQLALFESYTRVLLALAQQHPLLLILEDLHWADSGSLSLLFHLGRRLTGQPILVVGSYRPQEIAADRAATVKTTERHPLNRVLHEFQRLFGDPPLDLMGASGQAFVDGILNEDEYRVSAQFRDALYRFTRGHALFTTEMLRALQYRGGLVRDDQGYWVEGEPVDWSQLPGRIEGVIGARMDGLPPNLRELVDVASVLGEEFVAEAVARLVGREEQEVVRQLSGVLDKQHQLVQNYGATRVNGQRFSLYRFRHVLFQHYLYSALGEAERLYLHEAASVALEDLYRGNVDDVINQLAHHFRAAGVAGKAIHYLHQAGVQAMRRHANHEALHLIGDALTLLHDQPDIANRERQQLSLTLSLANAQWKIGQIAPALHSFQWAAEQARQLGLPEDLAQAALGYEYVRYRFNLPAETAAQLLRAAQQQLGPAESLLRVKVLGSLTRALLSTDEVGELEALSDEAIRMARHFNDPEALFDVLYSSVLAFRKPEKINQRLAALNEMEHLAETLGDLERKMSVYNCRIVEHLELGDIHAVDADLRESAQLDKQDQLPFYTAVGLTQQAMRALLAGRFAAAEALAQQALTIGQQMQLANADGPFGVQMFSIRREQGQLHQLAPVIRHFVEQSPQRAVWRPGLALIYADLGMKQAAQDQFEALAAADFSDIPHDALWLGSIAYLSEVCAFLGNSDHAATLYDLLRPYRGHTVVIGFGVVCYGAVARYQGLLATTLQRWDEADQHFRTAMQINSQMQALPWLAHTQADYAGMLLARAHPADRQKAATLLDEALSTAAQLGMHFLTAKARAVQTHYLCTD
jgi:DNA-binding SARP family transcriptional activator